MDASPKSNPEPLPNPADYAGNTPLHDAASAGDLAALTALLRGRGKMAVVMLDDAQPPPGRAVFYKYASSEVK